MNASISFDRTGAWQRVVGDNIDTIRPRPGAVKMVDSRGSWRTLLGVIFTVLTFSSTATGCPPVCVCASKIDNTVRVTCTSVTSMPDSTLFPVNANEFLVTFTGSPGIPAGAFSGLTNVQSIIVSGDIGDIQTGAFRNLRGNSASSEISLRNYGASSSATITTIEAEAFSDIQGFYSITFVYAIIDKISTNAFSNFNSIWGITFQFAPINVIEDTAFNNVIGGQSRSRLNFLYSSIVTMEGCAFLGLDQWYEIYFFQSSVSQLESFAFAGISNIEYFKMEIVTVTGSTGESYKGMGSVTNFVLSGVNPTPIIGSDPRLENATLAKLTARESCTDYTTIAISSSESPSTTLLYTSEAASTVESTVVTSGSAGTDTSSASTTASTMSTKPSPSTTESTTQYTTTGRSTQSKTTQPSSTGTTTTETRPSQSQTTTTTKKISSTAASATTASQTTTGSIKSPAAGASTNNDTSSSLGVMEIVMIIVLILLLVIVILLVIFLIVCWKRQNKKNKVVPEATKTTQTGSQYNDHEIPRTSLKDVRPAAVVPNGYNDSSVHYYTEKTGSQDGLVPEKRKSKKKKKKKQSEPEYDQPISYIVPEVRAAREPSQSASLRPSQSASLRPDPYYEELSSERETFRTPSPQPYRPVRRPKHGESVPSGYSPRAPRDAQHHRSFSTKEPELMTYRSSYDADDADEYEPVYAQLEPPHNNGRGSSAPDPTY